MSSAYDNPLHHALAEHDPVRIHGWAHDIVTQAEICLLPQEPMLRKLGRITARVWDDFEESMAACSPDALAAYEAEKRRKNQ